MSEDNWDELKALYQARKYEIEQEWRRRKQPKTKEEMFDLLVSCILSSRAYWPSVKKAMTRLRQERTHCKGDVDEIEVKLKGIRGRYINSNISAKRIFAARETFAFPYLNVRDIQGNEISFTEPGQSQVHRSRQPTHICETLQRKDISSDGLRAFIRKSFDGVGCKQASHFLSGLGFEDYAILDSHVIEQLVKYGVIEQKPNRLSRAKYREIERKMKVFSGEIGIPFHHLDRLFFAP